MNSARTSDELKSNKADYFEFVAGNLDWPERLDAARRRRLKTVAVIGAAVPEPLFWACGAAPIFVDRLARSGWIEDAKDVPPKFAYERAQGLGKVTNVSYALPRDACAVSRAGFDLLANGWIPAGLIDAVIVAAGCDWATRMGDQLAPMVPVWSLNVGRVPAAAPSKKSTSERSIRASLERTLAALELFTDVPLTQDAFEREYEHAMGLQMLGNHLHGLRAATPARLSACDYYRILGALELAAPEQWVKEVDELLAAGVEPAKSRGGPRVMLCGCPTGFPDGAFVRMVEECGLQIVGDDLALHPRPMYRGAMPESGRKGILKWMTEALALRMRDLDEGLGAAGEPTSLACYDGVIWLHYRGCAASAMEAVRALNRRMPTLAIELEQTSPLPGALQTRLEAFREQLTMR